MIPIIVEIAGVAGAGKTTLCNAMNRNNKSTQQGNFPNVRKISDTPFFIWNGIRISPFLIGMSQNDGRKLTVREFAWLTILYGWPGNLRKELSNYKVLILDQGPVYLLTELNEFGPVNLRGKKTEEFWHKLYSRWADTLDMVVWLDASDTDLLIRIRKRDKGHIVKNESDGKILEFLYRYRTGYRRIISNLENSNNDLKVIKYDTSRLSTEIIADQLCCELGLT